MFNSFQTEKISNGDVINLSQFSMANNEDKNFIIYGVGDDTEFINLKDRGGKPLTFNKTIITKSLAEKLKIEKGSKIEVKNNLNLVEFEVESMILQMCI
ncbi:hypothetical protein SH2C18_24590 [Clostridium sediminicola]|uniref:hypothetical protein n=1 Tax=Clostridium sediminicola TaxID=3114879 RepID=UPI0031F265BB